MLGIWTCTSLILQVLYPLSSLPVCAVASSQVQDHALGVFPEVLSIPLNDECRNLQLVSIELLVS